MCAGALRSQKIFNILGAGLIHIYIYVIIHKCFFLMLGIEPGTLHIQDKHTLLSSVLFFLNFVHVCLLV